MTISYIRSDVRSRELLEKRILISYNLSGMRKDAPLAFRIPADLKEKLQGLAKLEARSISQICEMFLRLGVEGYEKEGPKLLQHFLSRQKKDSSSQ